MQTNFHVALETSQRVVKETAERDKMQITAVLDGLQRILEVLNNSYDIMQNLSLLAQQYKAPNIVTGKVLQVSICPLVDHSAIQSVALRNSLSVEGKKKTNIHH